MTATMTAAVHQSRWGYHPISRESSKKLRFLNGVYAKSQHLAAAWVRWNAKLPENRIQKRAVRDAKGVKIGTEVVRDADGKPFPVKEPKACPIFHTCWKAGFPYSDNGIGAIVLQASRSARMPVATPEEVQPLDITEDEIDKIYEAAKEWLANR